MNPKVSLNVGLAGTNLCRTTSVGSRKVPGGGAGYPIPHTRAREGSTPTISADVRNHPHFPPETRMQSGSNVRPSLAPLLGAVQPPLKFNRRPRHPMNTTDDERRVIYRVQDKDGRGPWKPGFSHQWVEDRPDEEFEKLVPWMVQFGRVDRRAIYGMAVGCGCTSLDQLRQWFTPGEYATLRRLGYQAVRMKVGRVLAESDIQCVFERAKPLAVDAEPVDLYPPNVFTEEYARRRLGLAEVGVELGKACD